MCIAGWLWGRISNDLCTGSCISALEDAILTYGSPEILNSDQGSQFTSESWVNTVLSYKKNSVKLVKVGVLITFILRDYGDLLNMKDLISINGILYIHWKLISVNGCVGTIITDLISLWTILLLLKCYLNL